MARNTTEKERKEVIEKTEARETAQPYTSELEDRVAEQNRKKQTPERKGAGEDASERRER
jgi:hypothetical protein